MKLSKMAIVLAVAGLLTGAKASAQQSYDDVRQPTSRQAAYVNNYFDPGQTSSPSGVPVAATAPAAACSTCTTSSCSSDFCKTSCDNCDPPLGDPFKLFDCCLLDRLGMKINGWIAQSYTANFASPSNRFNGPVTWTDRSNQYQLNEAYIYMDRPTDTGGAGWDLGWRADAFYGTSYRWDTEAGLESKWNSQQFYGVALPQAYMEVAYNDLKVKLGHFISPVGYFTVGTFNNFFNTIPYTYQYGEPFTHTGGLATYTVTDKLTLGAGVINGWDSFGPYTSSASTLAQIGGVPPGGAYNHNAGYLGTATRTNLLKEGDSLAFVQLYSREPNQVPNFAQGGGFSTRYFQTLVYSRPLSDKFNYVIQSDFGAQGKATTTGHTARWYGINQYLYYKYSNRWSWGINGEWFRDEDGFRVAAPVPSFGSPNARGFAQGPGFAGNFYQVTMGPRWTPHPNLVIRPNLRFDWYGGKSDINGFRPYDNGTKSQQQILATDVIVTF
jgi:hypothetical protein